MVIGSMPKYQHHEYCNNIVKSVLELSEGDNASLKLALAVQKEAIDQQKSPTRDDAVTKTTEPAAEPTNLSTPSLLAAIKQEREDTETNNVGSNCSSKDTAIVDGQPLAKRTKVECVDAESNTLQTGEFSSMHNWVLSF